VAVCEEIFIVTPDAIYMAILGHQEMMLTYSVRQQRLARELNEYINKQLDVLWENKESLMELRILDDLMGNVKQLAHLSQEQMDVNVSSTDAHLEMVQQLLGVTET
jgi:hypothetical protein